MEIRDKIISIRTDRNKPDLIRWFENHPEQLGPLVNEITQLSDYPYKEYASWILFHLCRSSELNIQPYYNQLVNVIFKTEDQTVLRNVVNCISTLEVTEYRESELIDKLIGFIQEPKNKVALHVYSIYTLIQFVKKYPELKSEILEIIILNERGKTAAYKVAKRNFILAIKNF